MLVLVISTPLPSAPERGAARRLQWREWAAELQRKGEVREWYLRTGRGAVIVFDVEDNDALHARLTEWLSYVPAHFDIYPLVTPEKHEQLLRRISGERGDSASTEAP
jgi:muconolactone delta-isomerase